AVAAWRRARPVREVLFFPSRPCCIEALLAEAAEPGAPARPCPCPLPSGDTALSRLVRRLLSARRSLDLCLFSFSCPQLARAVQLLHRRGVRVRLVTDAQYMGLHGSQIGRLRHAGERCG
ncbi:mitochondrial cardiolipin hydrolase-like, partial [Pyrgilauda ruficollis]|uniref:mitochondrial cardiolipin hydrolase-like n=1 Tax=Pyrgilauda ruficollis TaxID=221976 RepID=UPI001B883FF5